MELPEGAGLTYRQARDRQRTHPIRLAEVPVEHAVSLPLPTKRWGVPGYAQFAAPAVRQPDRPHQQGPPDRWWVLDARWGRLVVYALTVAVPFAAGEPFAAVELPLVGGSLDERRRLLADLDDAFEALAPEFFAGLAGDSGLRRRASLWLAVAVPEQLSAQYRALAPDFFSWLEA